MFVSQTDARIHRGGLLTRISLLPRLLASPIVCGGIGAIASFLSSFLLPAAAGVTG